MCLDSDKLSSFIDGILEQDENLIIQEHLSSCSKCNNLVEVYKLSIKTVNSFNYDNFSDSFIDNIFSKIDNIKHPSFEDLSGYHDEFLEPEKTEFISEHITECYPCENTLENIKLQSKEVSKTPNYFVSDDFMDSLMSKLDALEVVETPKEEVFVGNHISFEDLSAYSDSEATDTNYQEIEKHLALCEACDKTYLSIKISKSYIQNAKVSNIVSLDFSNKVIEKIAKEEKKVVPFIRRIMPRISMVAGIVIAGILVLVSKDMITEPENIQLQASNIKVTVQSEDFLFSSDSNYASDSIDILASKSSEGTMEIEDIGL